MLEPVKFLLKPKTKDNSKFLLGNQAGINNHCKGQLLLNIDQNMLQTNQKIKIYQFEHPNFIAYNLFPISKILTQTHINLTFHFIESHYYNKIASYFDIHSLCNAKQI